MKKSVRNSLIILVAVASVIGTIFYLMMPLEVDTKALSRDDIYDYVEESGMVTSASKASVTVKVADQVTSVLKSNGDSVKAGEALFTIDDALLKTQLDGINAQIEGYDSDKNNSLKTIKRQISQQSSVTNQLKDQRDYAEENYKDATSLYEAGSMSESELKMAKQTFESADYAYNQAAIGLSSLNGQYNDLLSSDSGLNVLVSQADQLELQASYTEVTAPTDGILTGFDLHVGDYVVPQMVYGSILDPSAYVVETYVLTDDVYNLAFGDAVHLILKRNGEESLYEGTIASISPIAESKVSSLGLVEQRIKVTVSSDELSEVVKAGYDVKVKFISEYQLDAIAIPKTSIFYEGDNAYVFVDQNGKASKVKVTLGMETDDKVVIATGLEDGDVLISNYKVEGLEDGKAVK